MLQSWLFLAVVLALAGCAAPDQQAQQDDTIEDDQGGSTQEGAGSDGEESSGNSTGGETESNAPANPLTLTSEALVDGDPIPERFTCDGTDVSPPLAWHNVPDGTVTTAFIMDDPDAPGGAWDHWLWWDLPVEQQALGEDTDPSERGATIGQNSFSDNNQQYRGPCPPADDDPHHYRFTLYALDATLGLEAENGSDALRQAMEGKILEQVTLTSTFGRS